MTDETTKLPVHELTPRQRVVAYLARNLSNDMQTGTVAEQHTAALLALVADAVGNGYEADLVRVGREWRAATERAVDRGWVSGWKSWNDGTEA